MAGSYTEQTPLPELGLWKRIEGQRVLLDFELELTARCNNDCRHCYIALPAGDAAVKSQELALDEIRRIATEAVAMGAVWCLVTGGEPLLRDDFEEVYIMLKRLGLLVSVFTNACLVTTRHVELLRKYPPRDIEVTMYGATPETYERVTRRPGSFAAFERGLALLLGSGVKVRLKAMALRSNVHELPEIARFCRARTKDLYRFDPLLHLRYDGDLARNDAIRAERLSPAEVVAIERADHERFAALQRGCDKLVTPTVSQTACDYLFHCGAGNRGFAVSYDGKFRLCSSLWRPDTVYDLRHGALREAWEQVVPRVRDLRSPDPEFLSRCRICPLINLCMWCPARAHLETGRMDAYVDYFCRVAHARAESLLGTRSQAGDGERQ